MRLGVGPKLCCIFIYIDSGTLKREARQSEKEGDVAGARVGKGGGVGGVGGNGGGGGASTVSLGQAVEVIYMYMYIDISRHWHLEARSAPV